MKGGERGNTNKEVPTGTFVPQVHGLPSRAKLTLYTLSGILLEALAIADGD